MTTRPYELLARFRPDGTVAGVSVRTLTTVGGKDYESDPVALSGSSDPAFAAFATQFAAAAATERDSLQASLATLTTEHDALQVQVDRIPGLESQISDLTTERDSLVAEVARLTALVPPTLGPREITAEEFLARFTVDDRVAIGLSRDPRVILAQQELFTRRARIDLDSARLRALIDGLVAAGIALTEAEIATIFA